MVVMRDIGLSRSISDRLLLEQSQLLQRPGESVYFIKARQMATCGRVCTLHFHRHSCKYANSCLSSTREFSTASTVWLLAFPWIREVPIQVVLSLQTAF